MTSMYKVVKTVTSTKHRHEPFTDFYEVYEEIGSGEFAVVHRVIEKSTRTEYAAKYIKKKRVETSRRGVAMRDIEKEIHILAEMEHDNIIYLHQVYENQQYVILIIELLRGGELFDFIAERERLTEEEASFFIKQILLGVQHLHTHNTAHLDLKPENVMLLNNKCRTVKLIDFGLSRKILPGTEVREMLGTPEFVSPEVVNYEPLSLNTDLWSIGVITYIMLSGLSPFLGDTQQQTYENIVAVDYTFDEEGFENSSDLAKDFIQKLLVKEPRKRGSVWECLNHPWIFPRIPNDILSRQSNEIHMDNLRNYQARKRWKHSMKVVFLCNRLSRTRLRPGGSWHALLEGREGTQEISFTRQGTPNLLTIQPAQQQQEDDNFVLSAIFCAIEEDNQAGLEELLNMANIDVNQGNKHGEAGVHIAAGLGRLDMLRVLGGHGADLGATDSAGDSALYWAARQGHAAVIRWLVDQGVSLDTQNKLGEACIHTGCKYGHTEVVQYLVDTGHNLDTQDQHLETGLHIAAWHGFPRIVEILCQAGASVRARNEEEETPLHVAAARGHIECIRCLLDCSEGGAVIDTQDRGGATPLHLAIRRHHTHAALLLLHSGADFDTADSEGETAVHVCARDGQLGLAQTLCAFGCNVDVANCEGMQPLHLAAKHGNTEVARCLCLAGASIDATNREGVAAETCARVQGHADLGDLLQLLRRDGGTEEYIEQLIPTAQPVTRIKIKLFGQCGVGKSSLVDSLKAGYFSSLFRRSKRGGQPREPGHAGDGQEEEGDEVEDKKDAQEGRRKGSWHSHISIRTRQQELSLGGEVAAVAGVQGPSQDQGTRAISVQQLSLGGVGDCSVWEFSGCERYHLTYDHFIGNTNCIHVVMFSLADPPAVQLEQVSFWLTFLQSRIPPVEPLGDCGRSHRAASVVLVGSRLDAVSRGQGEAAARALRAAVWERFGQIFSLEEEVVVLDTTAPGSGEMKALKVLLQRRKQQLIEGLPRATAFLDQVTSCLPDWAASLAPWPVVTWPQFVEFLHQAVNPLAGEEHLKEVTQQLQLMGEVVYLKAEEADLVVLRPAWLCSDLLGAVLGRELRQLVPGPALTRPQLQEAACQVPGLDTLAASSTRDLLQLLAALGLATETREEEEAEHELPVFSRPEAAGDGEAAQWRRDPDTWTHYGGVTLRCGHPQLAAALWPRVQTMLRRSVARKPGPGHGWQLEQSAASSCVAAGRLQARVTSPGSSGAMAVTVRGMGDTARQCFYFLEEILGIIDQVLLEMSPGLPVDKLIVSSRDLARHAPQPSTWSPAHLVAAMMEGGWAATLAPTQETVQQVLCWDDASVTAALVPGPALPVSSLSTVTRQALCRLLDPAHPAGTDWCMLAVSLGLSDKVPKLDVGAGSYSQTARLLDEWAGQESSTVGKLVSAVRTLGREDAAAVVMGGCSLYRIVPGHKGGTI